MKFLTAILVFCIGNIDWCYAQQNLNFERWDINYNGIDEAKNWINISDATSYGAPQVLFKEVNNPAEGLASIKLTTTYWETGAEYGLDTLVGSLIQKNDYQKRPESFEFAYKSFPKLGDEILVGVQLTITVNDSTIVVGEGFFSTNQIENEWKNEKVSINYYSSYTPDEITLIALSSANATILDGSLGHAKIGSTLWLDNFRLSSATNTTVETDYFIHVFPNPAKTHITISTNNPAPLFINLYTLTGKLVLNANFSEKTKLDITTLPTGTYVYNIVDPTTNLITASNKFNIVK